MFWINKSQFVGLSRFYRGSFLMQNAENKIKNIAVRYNKLAFSPLFSCFLTFWFLTQYIALVRFLTGAFYAQNPFVRTKSAQRWTKDEQKVNFQGNLSVKNVCWHYTKWEFMIKNCHMILLYPFKGVLWNIKSFII